LDLESWFRWVISNWLAVLRVLATIVFGLLTTILGYLAIRKPRWRKYRCRCLPYERIFREKEYGYDPKTFLTDVGSLERNFKTLQDWHAGKTKPLLVRGAIGSGKSRLASEFIGRLSLRERVRTTILMPTVNDMREKMPPRFLNGCILFLNDLHEFRGAVDDSRLIQLLLDKKTKILATIPDEGYDPSWPVLQSHYWQEMKVEHWTEREGRRLAEVKNIRFDTTDFTGTPLSVIAPAAEIRRQFDSLPRNRKAVLEALKVIRTHLGCFATCELASALTVPSGRFDEQAFTDIIAIRKLWCKTDGPTAILADGMDDFVKYEVSRRDAYGLQIVLTRSERPITRREAYLFYLGFRFSRLGDYNRSLECYDQSKDLNPTNPATWFNRGLVLIILGRIEDAKTSYNKAKELFEKRGIKLGIVATLFQLGTIAQNRPDPSEAVKLFNESLSIYRAVNDKMGEAIVIHHLGMIEQAKHHYPEARELYNQSLKIKRKLGYRPVMSVTLFNLAKIEVDEFGDLDKARVLSDECLEISKESGDWLGVANTLDQLYRIEYWKSNYVEAKKFYDQSQEIKRKLRRDSTANDSNEVMSSRS
jgi:hypothetical protein